MTAWATYNPDVLTWTGTKAEEVQLLLRSSTSVALIVGNAHAICLAYAITTELWCVGLHRGVHKLSTIVYALLSCTQQQEVRRVHTTSTECPGKKCQPKLKAERHFEMYVPQSSLMP